MPQGHIIKRLKTAPIHVVDTSHMNGCFRVGKLRLPLLPGYKKMGYQYISFLYVQIFGQKGSHRLLRRPAAGRSRPHKGHQVKIHRAVRIRKRHLLQRRTAGARNIKSLFFQNRLAEAKALRRIMIPRDYQHRDSLCQQLCQEFIQQLHRRRRRHRPVINIPGNQKGIRLFLSGRFQQLVQDITLIRKL